MAEKKKAFVYIHSDSNFRVKFKSLRKTTYKRFFNPDDFQAFIGQFDEVIFYERQGDFWVSREIIESKKESLVTTQDKREIERVLEKRRREESRWSIPPEKALGTHMFTYK